MSCNNYFFLTVIYAYSYGGLRVLSKNYSLLRLRPSLMAGKYTVLYKYRACFLNIFFRYFFIRLRMRKLHQCAIIVLRDWRHFFVLYAFSYPILEIFSGLIFFNLAIVASQLTINCVFLICSIITGIINLLLINLYNY